MIYLMQLKPKQEEQLTLAKISVDFISIIETINQAVVIFDDRNNCLFFNAVAEQILGNKDNIPLLVDWAQSLDGRLSKHIDALPPNELCSAIASLSSEEVNDLEIFLSQVDISDDFQVEFKPQNNLLETHNVSAEPMVLSDFIDEQLREERSLNHVLYDKLTRLPNQNLLLQLIQESIISIHNSQDYLFAVFFIDIDRFQVINSSLGRMLGNQLLRSIASRLRKCLRSQDLIARIGGDEFAVLLQNIEDNNDVQKNYRTNLSRAKITFQSEWI